MAYTVEADFADRPVALVLRRTLRKLLPARSRICPAPSLLVIARIGLAIMCRPRTVSRGVAFGGLSGVADSSFAGFYAFFPK
jgi:hypothetical protein